MRHTFSQRLAAAVSAAAASINRYQGPGRVRLATGEYAIDNDDSWIIQCDPGTSPRCRDKREQRLREKEGDSRSAGWEDYLITDNWPAEDICGYADRLAAKAASFRKA